MVQLKSNTMLNAVESYSECDFSLNARYLWIWSPTSIPPHMGVSIDGRYFSLKASGLDFNTDLQGIIDIISRKGISVVAVELKKEFTLQDCLDTFANYTNTVAYEVTCLNPIKAVLKQNQPTKLVELLGELDSNQLLGRKTAWNINQSVIALKEYSIEEIHDHLVALSK